MKTQKITLSLIAVSVLSACANMTTADMKTKHAEDTTQARDRIQEILKAQLPAPSNYTEPTERPLIAVKPLDKQQQAALEKKWLTDIQNISLDPAKKEAVPATAIIRMLRAKGINIVSHLPLDMYSYNGFGVTNVNAETALMVFLGAMGLDYELDNARQLVVIQPLKSLTWRLNIGNRRTSFNAGDENTGTGSTSSNSTGSSNGQLPGLASNSSGFGNTGSNSSMGGSGNTAGANNNANSQTGGNTNTITANDDVWNRLNSELTQRLIMNFPRTATNTATGTGVPAISDPMAGNPMANMNSGSGMGMGTMNGQVPSYFNRLSVGTVTINPETGAVTVQAPRYLLDTLDKYMRSVLKQYNTVITFEAEVLTLTSTQSSSEGLDWSAFNTLSNGSLQTIAQNNILGGVTINPANGTASIVDSVAIGSANLPGANALFGVASVSKKFAAINAYLATVGQLKIKDTPVITTTSGSPVKLKNTTIRHYQQYQQTAAAGGTGSAAVATNTIDIPYETGMTLRLNPRYDVETGLVRTQFAIDRKNLQGWTDKQSPIVTGNNVQIIQSRVPIINETNQNGDLLLRNGAFVVVGGLTEDTVDDNTSGLPGFMDSPLRGLTGKESKNHIKTTYYFALRVTINDPSENQ